MTQTLANNYYTQSTLTLDINDYPGGVAIWGALPAVFDTTSQGFDRGVHVHARIAPYSKKAIDQTYEVVHVITGDSHYTITEEIAVNFSLASIFQHKIISLTCARCQQPVISSQLFSLIPHHEHICNKCGYINMTSEACVVNPVIDLKHKLGDAAVKRKSILPNRAIKLSSEKYKGGIQIWGSNPSILWTATRLEESAIHVHAYNDDGERIVDNTYSQVMLFGNSLDIEMIRTLQIQQCLSELNVAITTVSCPGCGEAQFDRGIYAVLPQQSRTCRKCQSFFTTATPSISNPVSTILKK